MKIHRISRIFVSGLISALILIAVLGNKEAQAGRDSVVRLGIDMTRGLGLLKAARPALPQEIVEKMARRLGNLQRQGRIDDRDYMHVVEQLCSGKGPEDPEHLCNWVCTVAKNYCIDQWKKWKKDNPGMSIPDEAIYPKYKDVLDDIDDITINSNIIETLDKLNNTIRRVNAKEILMRHKNSGAMEEQYDDEKLKNCINSTIDELGSDALPLQMLLDRIPYKTIALELNIPEGTVKSKIARSRQKVRDACKKYY